MSTPQRQVQAGNVRVRRRWRLLARMLLGCMVVVAGVAATVATGTLLEVKAFVDALHQSPRLNLGNELATANAGGPQTLLLIGSDKRAKGAIDASSPPHSDTMILVRLDPNQPSTTMLSVPRDLKVTIHPDHGNAVVQKINASYTLGGAKLAVKTIKQLLGIKINHVIDINFGGFKALVNYLGCVYVQVDRRYYHSNIGLGAAQTYDEIDIQPGYQKLCGDDALHYVRYRHTDTDLVRSARQQDFLRQIKNQIGASGLISRRLGIEKIFGKYSETDIRSEDDVLKLLELAVQSASHPVRQVTFQATLGPSYVTANRAQITQTVHAFLNGGTALGHVTAGDAGPGQRPGRSPETGGERQRRIDAGHLRRAPTGAHGRHIDADPRVLPGKPDHERVCTAGHAAPVPPARQPPHVLRLCGRRRAGRPRPVLRPRGNHLGQASDPQQPEPDDPARRPQDAAVLRGSAVARGRVA